MQVLLLSSNCKTMVYQQRMKIRQGHVQWMISNFRRSRSYKSDPFKIGIWNWHLSIQRSGPTSTRSVVRLFPESEEELVPLARFSLYVTIDGKRKSTVEHNGLLCTNFAVRVKTNSSAVFLIDVLFLDLKISPSDGGEDICIWPNDDRRREATRRSRFKCFSRMLNESLCTDITINTADGKQLDAHRAVLSASSPVFHSMFKHDLKEKQSSTINIEDLTSDSCMALLNYMYGTINKEDLLKHRLPLLAAANKYDIPDLKDECEESLVEDIDLENVLERLQEASLYQLSKLKKGCMTYLIDSGKLYDLEEDMSDFLTRADKELTEEMFREVLLYKKRKND